MYVCIYVCMLLCKCVSIYVYYVCTFFLVSVQGLGVHMYVCTKTFRCVCKFTCMYVFVCMYRCMYVYMYVHMYVCTYRCMYVCRGGRMDEWMNRWNDACKE